MQKDFEWPIESAQRECDRLRRSPGAHGSLSALLESICVEEGASPTVFPTATCFKQRNEKYSEELHSDVFPKELYAKLSLLGLSLTLSTKWWLSRLLYPCLLSRGFSARCIRGCWGEAGSRFVLVCKATASSVEISHLATSTMNCIQIQIQMTLLSSEGQFGFTVCPFTMYRVKKGKINRLIDTHSQTL